MRALSEQKRLAIAGLIQACPDAVLAAIEGAFRTTPGPEAQAVRAAASQTLLERQVRTLAFGPAAALFAPRADGVRAPCFPKATADALWAELKSRRGEAVAILEKRLRERERDPPSPVLVDGLCAEAAALLNEGDPQRWALPDVASADSLHSLFQIAPVARAALPKLHDWLGRMDAERSAALRLSFKDASAVREDGGALLMELLMGQLEEAARVLRLVAAVTDRAGEAFVRSTELADFGERLVEAMETQARKTESLGPRATVDEVRVAITAMEAAAHILTEFEISLPQEAEGAWSRRLAAARRMIAARLETSLRGLEKLVDKALPLASVRIAGRMSRKAPDLTADPNGPAVASARAGLTLLAGARGVAAAYGCEATRQQAAEAVAARVDAYAEEILQTLHANEAPDAVHALALLEVAAEFLGLSRDDNAAELVRRRAAVAVEAGGRLSA